MFQNRFFRRAAALVLTLALAAAAALPGLAAYPMPIQTASETEAVYLFNADTGKTILAQNADQQQYVASLTKMMTALLLLESGKDLNGEVTVPTAMTQEFKDIQNANGMTAGLRIGETVRRIDLLYALLVSSANDAASVIAYDVGGSVLDFVRQMNARAAELGMTHTRFVNACGLDAEGHYSTARDMAKLACAALENETFRAIVSTKSTTVDGQTLVNHNRLLRSYDGAVGVKTGYTKTAGRTLVSCAQRGTTQFVCVTLSDPDDWNDHTHLLDWAFENYEYRCVAGDTPVYAVPVLSATVELCAAAPERPAYLLVHPDDQVSLKAELPRFTFAPVEQGTQAGTLTATGPDGQSVTVPLRYAEPAALDPDVKITPLARLGRLWTHACRYFSSYYYPVS